MSNEPENKPKVPQLAEVVTLEERQKIIDDAMSKSSDLLAYSVYYLVYNHGFLGHLLQMLVRTFTFDIPTAGVGALDMRYVLAVNPLFYSKLSKDEARAVLTHEVYHLLNHHMARGKGYDPRLWNVACDLSINCHIKGLPTFDREEQKQKLIGHGMTEAQAEKQLPKADKDGRCCTGLLPKDYGLPDNKTSEWYYKAIQENKDLKEQFQKPAANGFDLESGTTSMTPEEQEQLKQDLRDGKARFTFADSDHEKWEEMDNNGQGNLMDEELKRMIRDAINKSPETFGNLPGEMKESIMKFLQSEVNWKSKLRQFLQVATEVLRVNTRKRASRRYGITYPGQKTDYKLNLGIYIDSSGSISDTDLALFGGEVNRIFDTKLANIEIMAGDTKTNEHYEMKKRMTPKDFKISGRGGTDSHAWLSYIAKQKHLDAVVILTDGEFDYNMKKPKLPVLWAITQNGVSLADFKRNSKFGRVLKLEKDKRRD